jgi:hypothetical protein
MAYPVTGPNSSDYGHMTAGDSSYRIRTSRYGQTKPYSLALPYAVIREEILGYQASGGDSNPPAWASAYYNNANAYLRRALPLNASDPTVSGVIQKARTAFMGQLSESASWAQALLERQQTADLLGQRLFQIYRFARAVKQGNLGYAYHLLNPPHGRGTKGVRGTSRNLSESWLQWWFGVSPLLKDIDSSMTILESPLSPRRVVGKASGSGVSRDVWRESGGFGFSDFTRKHNWRIHVRVQAEMTVNNPNLFLASKMGFTNPLLLAYEVVPFSFIANWFVNLEEWLKQFDEYLGLHLGEPFHSVTTSHTGTTTQYSYWHHPDDPVFYQLYEATSRASLSERVLGVPDIKFGIRPPWKLSLSRAATATSLIVQLFGKR